MKNTSLRDQLLAEIDAFLDKSGMTDTRFGVESLNDKAWLHRFRAGLSPTIDTVDKVRRFMHSYKLNPRRRAEARAA